MSNLVPPHGAGSLKPLLLPLAERAGKPCPGGLATGIGRHELVVALQCGVRFGAIDNHAGYR
jgi:hypothetical protein